MPQTPVLKSEQIAVYLSGYTDGEGSFCISFSPRDRLKAKIEIRPSFSVSQNTDRSEVLYLMKEYFKCGSIRPDRSDKTLKYEVRSGRDLSEIIIPHFIQYPLLSSKQRDFINFAHVCFMMKQSEHKTSEGFNQICSLAEEINVAGLKKYSRKKIKV